MNEQLEVRIVNLEPLHLLSFHASGEQPEMLAYEQLLAWAEGHGLPDDGRPHRLFGFNNPGPQPGNPVYGYEFWLEVDPEESGDRQAPVKQFAGGRYAVVRCQGVSNITPTWKRLHAWRDENGYEPGSHQCLEEHLDPLQEIVPEKLRLDLYLSLAD